MNIELSDSLKALKADEAKEEVLSAIMFIASAIVIVTYMCIFV